MHRTTDQLWERYQALPEAVRNAADKSFQLLKENPRHPSLQPTFRASLTMHSGLFVSSDIDRFAQRTGEVEIVEQDGGEALCQNLS